MLCDRLQPNHRVNNFACLLNCTNACRASDLMKFPIGPKHLKLSLGWRLVLRQVIICVSFQCYNHCHCPLFCFGHLLGKSCPLGFACLMSSLVYADGALCHLSHVMRLWYFLSSVNAFFKRACAAIQWG